MSAEGVRALIKRSTLVASLTLAGTLGLSSWAPTELHGQDDVDLSNVGFDRGRPDAPIRIVEFGDFGCSACAEFARDTWSDFQREFIDTGMVAWKFIPFILGSFRNSEEATNAAMCVADQDLESFWSMHDLLYERQDDWKRPRNPREELEELVGQLDLDLEPFRNCYHEEEGKERIRRNNDAAKDLKVRATPTFYVNGRQVLGALPMDVWRKLIGAIRVGDPGR